MNPAVAASHGLEAVLSELTEDKQQAVDALHNLIEGNLRFCQSVQIGCTNDVDRRLQAQEGQHPKAVVICCSDSRCPPELIFDQGYGDIFVIRVAGIVVNQHVLGSISYALQQLRTRLIVVVGHTNCGAIKASVADFVDTTTKRLKEREEEEAEAEAEAARGEGIPIKRKGARSLFSRLFALFGGRDEMVRLVRTASFRDAEHAAHPINSIVLSIAPAVKDVVWALLQAPPEEIGQYAPPPKSRSNYSSAGSSPQTEEGNDASALYFASDEGEGEGDGSSSEDGGEDTASSGAVGSIMGELRRNSSAWGLPQLEWSDSEVEKSENIMGKGVEEGQGMHRVASHKAKSEAGGREMESEIHHLAPLRWDCDGLEGPMHTAPEVSEQELHETLAQSSENICLHTAMRCSKVVNSVVYQNVRRQGGEIWQAMSAWVEGEEMRHVLMATAVYDLATGRVDFFGLQSL